MTGLAEDLRHAFRNVIRNPGFSVIVIAILGIGIGASTAVLTVIDSVLYRQFPFKDPDRLVAVWSKNLKISWMDEGQTTPADLNDWSASNRSLELAGFTLPESFNISGDIAAQRIRGSRVSENFLDVLGVQLAIGHAFQADEMKREDGRLAVIGYGLWQTRFAGSPDILSRKVRLDGQDYSVIGVLPKQFQLVFFSGVDVLAPLRLSASEQADRANRTICVVGRLRQGVSFAQASADMNYLAADLGKQYPEDTDWGVNLVPLRKEGTEDVRQKFSVFFAIAFFILVIGTANVANLFLLRMSRRSGELAIRSALGGSRARLVRQLLFESLMLAGGAALLSLASAHFIAQQLRTHSPVYFPAGTQIRFDSSVLLLGLGVSIGAAVVFTLVPAVSAMRLNLASELMQMSSRAGGRSRSRALVQKNLVTLEVGLSFMLLVSAALTIQALMAVERVNLGFDSVNLTNFQISLPTSKYAERVTQLNFYEELLDRLRIVSGIEATAISQVPLGPDVMNHYMQMEDYVPQANGQRAFAATRVVMANYFSSMKIALLKGRFFNPRLDSFPVTVINRALADRYFPGKDPIGKELFVLEPMEADIDALRKGGREIIGVVEDVRDSGPDKSPWPEAYFSYEQNPVPSMSILLRSKSANLAFEIRREVMQLDPDLPVYNIMRMEDLVNSAANERRFQVVTVCVFAAIALLLAISGLYSTVSYSVIQRKQEIGIRMALGARPASVMRKVLSDGMVLGAIGVLFGVAGSFLVARFVNSLLYGVRLNDLNTIVSVTALILGVVFAASYLPSRQAAKVEPAVVLRADR